MAVLTHWGRATHICVGKLTIIGSDNGLSPGRRQAIIWTSAGILLIGPLRTNFSEILIEIYTFSFKKIDLKVSSGKWRPSCLGLNVLTTCLQRLKLYGHTKSSKESRLWPLLLTGLTLIPPWISNYIHYKVWGEINYPFLNFNGATVEV